jgi:fatty acid kinase fatty acid binding subunit
VTIRIVTDSTCDLPYEVTQAQRISVVPLVINADGRSYRDGVDISRQEFYERLPHFKSSPTTSAPGIGVFRESYDRLAAEGAREILSIHIASSLSAVVNSARLAAHEVTAAKVTVLDSGQLSLGTGFLALTAARAAAEGATMDELLAQLANQARRTHVIAALDSVEYLHRSGRVSGFQSGLAALLQIKPLITMNDGRAGSERVRTRARAVRRVVELTAALGPLEQLALVHTNAPREAEALAAKALHLMPSGQPLLAVNVTSVIGAHIGPGAVGFACIAASPAQG